MEITLIPKICRVDGLIETAGDLVVEGRADGRLEVGGTLTVAAGATCRATVKARAASISGEVLGQVVCSSAIEVTAGGRVVGDLRAPEIEVDAHAFVDGRVDLLPPSPEASSVRRAPVIARGPGVRRPSPPLPVTEVEPSRTEPHRDANRPGATGPGPTE